MRTITNRQTGFTLIELLVVITIIVVLLALFAPALDKAIEQAQRVVCGANLHVFGAGNTQYAMDHRRTLMSIPQHYGGNSYYCNLIWVHATARPGQFSIEAINPYVGGRDQSRDLGGVWRCPSNQAAWIRSINDTRARGRRDDAAGIATSTGLDHGWFVIAEYSYYGQGAKLSRANATRPEALAPARLGGNGLLMSDAVVLIRPSSIDWQFNHGEYQRFGVPDVEGINHLFADNAVSWSGGGNWPLERRQAMNVGGPLDKMGDFVSGVGQIQSGNINAANDVLTFW